MAKRVANNTEKPVNKKTRSKCGEKDIAPIYRLHEMAVDMGIEDLAENLDHYLYGTPKQSESELRQSGIIASEGITMAKAAVKEKPKPVSKGKHARRKVRDKYSIFRINEMAMDMGIEDLAENFREYLYGGRKAEDGE